MVSQPNHWVFEKTSANLGITRRYTKNMTSQIWIRQIRPSTSQHFSTKNDEINEHGELKKEWEQLTGNSPAKQLMLHQLGLQAWWFPGPIDTVSIPWTRCQSTRMRNEALSQQTSEVSRPVGKTRDHLASSEWWSPVPNDDLWGQHLMNIYEYLWIIHKK